MAIHLVSDNPLNVYAFNWSPNSSDVAVIYPTESLGSEYFAMCYDPHLSSVNVITGDAQGKDSEFMVVASQDNTEVWITPTKVTDKLRPANIPFKIVLNRGEVYQVQSENLPNTSLLGQGDLTGSYIKSNKPCSRFFPEIMPQQSPFLRAMPMTIYMNSYHRCRPGEGNLLPYRSCHA